MSPDLPSPDLSPKLVKAARALLAWSQQDLAKRAGVATSTVADFERGSRTPIEQNAQAIRKALQDSGVRFLPGGAVIGPPIPSITSFTHGGVPVRWVSAEDLSGWADTNDGPLSLPTLLTYLVRATHGPGVHPRFPSDESTRFSGWDGRTTAEEGSEYVPAGETGWELGAQRSQIAQKASSDYAKRTADPEPLDPAASTYIFVTPRRWPAKDQWAKAREGEGPWRSVRVYDADDLVHWIEQTPAVGLWLARRLNNRPPDVRELDEVWSEWSQASEFPLTEALVLCDRDQEAVDVLGWLRDAPSVLSLRSTTADEVIAFFHATLSDLPDEVAAAYRARCLVATMTQAARGLADAPGPLIIILTEPDPGVAQVLAGRGHYVLQAYDDRPMTAGEVRELARPFRSSITVALEAMGIPHARAEALARDSNRNLTVLRRLVPPAPGRLPPWATTQPPQALLAALLLGGWDETNEADKAQLSAVAGQPYEAAERVLAGYAGRFDRPLEKVGTFWRVASPYDAWHLLAQHLTKADVDRFEAAASVILGSADPKFDMEPDERWLAAIRGVHEEYSAILRHGVGKTLILMALWGEKISTVADARRRPDAVVRRLLGAANDRRWWSLSSDFRLLGEASPSSFLRAIEDSLDQNRPAIEVLFGHDEGGVFGTEHLSDLMWALESLAWSPELLPRVSEVLARLQALDVKKRRFSNGPGHSLRMINLLWNPQTFAPQAERLRAIDALRQREPDAAWVLLLGILPQGHDSSELAAKPRWRDFTVDAPETVTWQLIRRGGDEVSRRLVEDVGSSVSRWSQLLERLSDLSPDPASALDALEAFEARLQDGEDRRRLWEELRAVLHHHRQFPDAQWRLPDEPLDRLDALYERFAPAEAVDRVAWLFKLSARLPRPSPEGWETEERDLGIARREAARALFVQSGVDGLLALAQRTEMPGFIGKALYEEGVSDEQMGELLERSLRSEEGRQRDLGYGLIVAALPERGDDWGEGLLPRAQTWGQDAQMTILRALPLRRRTWDLAASLGEEVETAYWRGAPIYWFSEDAGEVDFALRKVIGVSRARQALPLAARGAKVAVATDLLVTLLEEALPQANEADESGNDRTMFQHYVVSIFKMLDERDDLAPERLISLEWKYLALLEYSDRPAKAWLRALSEQPRLFVEILQILYKSKGEEEAADPSPADPPPKLLWEQAYRLLSLWNRIPGTQDDGSIDGAALELWVREARRQAKAIGREEIADYKIGEMLSAAPVGADGVWPCEPVREVLDLFRSSRILEGFRIGKQNRRGATVRGPRDGGSLERDEAARYRGWAEQLAFNHPRTARALEEMAESYEAFAQREDEAAERIDWV